MLPIKKLLNINLLNNIFKYIILKGWKIQPFFLYLDINKKIKVMTNVNPTCYLFLGSSGSGKSYHYQKSLLGIVPEINIDTFYEELLIKNNLNLKQNSFSLEENILAGKLLNQSKKEVDNLLNNFIENKLSFCYNTTGISFKKINNFYNKLIENNYNVKCIFCYSSLYTVLNHNLNRERSLKSTIVIKSYYDVNKNFLNYQNLFNDFTVITNEKLYYCTINLQTIQPYLGEYKKYDEKSTQKFNELLNNCEYLHNNIFVNYKNFKSNYEL